MPLVNRKAPRATHTQSLIFNQRQWTEVQARKWVRDHDFRLDGFEETGGSFRFRQFDPEANVFRYRNQGIKSGSRDITLVQGFVK